MGLVVLLILIVQLADLSLGQTILDRKSKSDVLPIVVSDSQWGSLSSGIVGPIDVYKCSWEGQERHSGSNHVPAPRHDLSIISFLGYRVVLDTVLNWLDRSNRD